MTKYKPSELEKSFEPDCWELEDNEKTTILDEELDAFECQFNGDGCVTIDTAKIAYIVLNVRHLQGLIYLINKAEKAQNI